MFLREIFEAPKVATFAFGRMNPPTIGHAKLVDKIKSQDGEPFLFLTHTQKPKTDPLSFAEKVFFAEKSFSGIKIGDQSVKTIIDAMKFLEAKGYSDIIYVAGSDRVAQFEKLLNDYNGKDYNFNSINVVNAGQRDPDAEGAEGMSASKLKAAAAEGDFETFKTGVQYQIFHGLGLILIGILSKVLEVDLSMSGYFIIAGVLFFSGSLFLISIFKLSFMGAIAPIGGLSFILGWITLFLKINS